MQFPAVMLGRAVRRSERRGKLHSPAEIVSSFFIGDVIYDDLAS